MRYFKYFCMGLVLLLLKTAAISSQEKNQEQAKQNPPSVRLIKMDLLDREIKKLGPPKRNIFTPYRADLPEMEEIEDWEQAEQPVRETFEPELTSIQTFALRYIGYVKSVKKITALILFEGEALAVDVGEEIDGGVTISMITLESITVTGLDQDPWTFPLEGEIR